ncbi:MAG: hypothetical protein QXH02_02960 [Desulfurococcaceae archaeon]
MVVTCNLDIVGLSLILTGATILVALITVAIVVVARRGRMSTEGAEMYIGGEGEEVLRRKIPSVLALYWGIVRKAWRRAFETLRDSVHTGVLNDWYGYMSMWLGLVLLIALIALIVYVVW